ncbi:MAG: TIM barrel protein [Pseudomonadota bacterium]
MRFSANLGFLWADRPLADGIRAAHRAGFAAVECHWPYDQPVEDVQAALLDTGLPMLGLNTHRGKSGENGLSALVGRETDARGAINQAIAYAEAVDARAIHAMAGFADGHEARNTFVDNLLYACDATDRTILIEPLNRHDAPGYFLQTTDQAAGIIAEADQPNLKLMFDCYHVGRTEGDVTTRLAALREVIGHIQIAAVPDRGAPDHGELNYTAVFEAVEALDWPHPVGAEYKPDGATEDSLGWLSARS